MRSDDNLRVIIRFGLALVVLMAGVSLLPLTGISAEKLGWETYAGIYQPELSVVGKSSGAAGSDFLFSGSGYPPNTRAIVYVDGRTRGTLITDSMGQVRFLLQTAIGSPQVSFFVTLAVDASISATAGIQLDNDEPLVVRPSRWAGPTFALYGRAAGGDDYRQPRPY